MTNPCNIRTWRRILGALALSCVLAPWGAGSAAADAVSDADPRMAFFLDVDGIGDPGPGAPVDLSKLGYKSPPVILHRPSGVFRILFIGGSSVYSITTPQYSFPAAFARHLQRQFPDKTLEVVNLGVPGAGFIEHMAVYRFWRHRIDHDAVVYAVHPGSDWQDHKHSHALSLFGPGVTERTDILVSPNGVNAAIRAAATKRNPAPAAPTPPASAAPPIDERYEAQNQYTDAAYVKILSNWSLPYRPGTIGALCTGHEWAKRFITFIAEAEQASPPSVVLLLPTHAGVSAQWRARLLAELRASGDDLDPHIPAAVLLRFAERAGMQTPVFDITDALRRQAENGTDLYYGTNAHWSVAGNAIAGEVAAALAARHLVPAAAEPQGENAAPTIPRESLETWQPVADAIWDGTNPRCG